MSLAHSPERAALLQAIARLDLAVLRKHPFKGPR